PIGRGEEKRPVHWQVARPPSWLAMVLAIAADGTALASLLFGGLFLWLVAPQWPPAEISVPAPLPGIAALIALCAASFCARLSLRVGAVPWLVAALAGQLLAALLFAFLA